MRIRYLILVAIGLVALIGAWFGLRPHPNATAPQAELEPVVENVEPASAEPLTPPEMAVVPRTQVVVPAPATPQTPSPSTAPATPTTTLVTPVENPRTAIDDILTSEEISDDDRWRRLLQILPAMSEAFQEEAVQHVCNLIPDESFGALGPLLTNAVAPEPLVDVVMTDLLARPNTLKLPLLLTIARNPQHTRAEEARSVIELYIEQDHGADWQAWEKSVQAWLRDNPE